MAPTKPDLPQGTLDLLILKMLALGTLHGYAIAQRIQQISRDASSSSRAPSIRRCTGWRTADTCRRNGTATPAAKRSSIG